jgi:hypothetical protein
MYIKETVMNRNAYLSIVASILAVSAFAQQQNQASPEPGAGNQTPNATERQSVPVSPHQKDVVRSQKKDGAGAAPDDERANAGEPGNAVEKGKTPPEASQQGAVERQPVPVSPHQKEVMRPAGKDQKHGKSANNKETEQGAAAATTPNAQVRDWSAIDTDKDNLISPDEMRKYLESSWAEKGNKTSGSEPSAKPTTN